MVNYYAYIVFAFFSGKFINIIVAAAVAVYVFFETIFYSNDLHANEKQTL